MEQSKFTQIVDQYLEPTLKQNIQKNANRVSDHQIESYRLGVKTQPCPTCHLPVKDRVVNIFVKERPVSGGTYIIGFCNICKKKVDPL